MTSTLNSHQHLAVAGNVHDTYYSGYLGRMATRFQSLVEARGALFTTDVSDLWQVYLNSYPERQRQYHNCNACRRFVEQFGGLVVIDDQGHTESPIWDESQLSSSIDDVRAVAQMRQRVQQAKVTGVFLSDSAGLGQPITGNWRHVAVALPKDMVHRSRVQTAGQAMAEKREDYRTLMRAVGEFSRPHLDTALRLLNSEALFRAEKVLGPAKFLSDVAALWERADSHRHKQALTWRAIAAAPAGFCHPRSSMIGTLLEDIAAGMDFETVSRRFKAKMDPLAYQRPQAAPSAGTIAQAEKLVAQMGIERSLPRRFARPDELQALWKPKLAPAAASTGGVFGHLQAKGAAPVVDLNMPAQTMTWAKFRRTVLPAVDKVEIFVPRTITPVHFTTAVNADAPPILQWDDEEHRNPVAWYCWASGSMAANYYGLKANAFHPVSLVTLAPFQWHDEDAFSHQGARAAFVLDGVKESRAPGACLFPEILRSELHSVCSVIEAYSRRETLTGLADGPHAIGLCIHAGNRTQPALRLRVTEGTARREIHIDRWD